MTSDRLSLCCRSSDGKAVFVSSRDGFCSVIQFSEGELGAPVPPPPKILEQQQQQQQVTALSSLSSTPSLSKLGEASSTTTTAKPQQPTPTMSSEDIVDLDGPPLQATTSPLKRAADTTQSPDAKKRRIIPQLISASGDHN